MKTTDQPTYLLDVNVLIALTSRGHILHQHAHQWFDGVESWATTPLTETAYVRLMLNPFVIGAELRAADVLAALATLRRWPGHVFIEDASSLAAPAIDLIGLRGQKQVTDAHLVNLAASHGAVLATLDTAIEAMLMPDDRHWVQVI